MLDKTPPQSRRARLWRTAESQGIPLRAILVTVGVVVLTFMAGKLLYRLRDVLLLMAVSGFVALLLNPLVVYLQRWKVPRRGYAVAIVTFWAVLVFVGLAIAFGYPLVNAITHLADRLPSYVDQAQHGRGWIGHLIRRYHVTTWVQHNSAKITSFAQSLGKPALALGKGAVSLLVSLGTIFFLVLLLLLEGPKMRGWILSNMTPQRAATVRRVSAQVNRAVTGYMAGNLFTSVIAGAVVFVTLVVFLAYTQIENHILNPVVMSRTVQINPLLVLVSILVAASIGSWIGGLFGGFVAALLAIPFAGAGQVVASELWRDTAPPVPLGPPEPGAGAVAAAGAGPGGALVAGTGPAGAGSAGTVAAGPADAQAAGGEAAGGEATDGEAAGSEPAGGEPASATKPAN